MMSLPITVLIKNTTIQPFTNCRVYPNADILYVAQLLCDCAPAHRCKGGVLVDRHCLVDLVRCHCQSVKLETYGQNVSCSDRRCDRGGAGDGCVHWWLLDNACGLHECTRGGEGSECKGENEWEWRGVMGGNKSEKVKRMGEGKGEFSVAFSV